MAKSAIAVIPARGGSKRIPRKNIKLFDGKPIIAHTVEAALQSRLFSQVVVSTDSEEIALLAEQYGAEVPFLRDARLADDVTPVSAATVDVVQRLDATEDRFAYVCQLTPNCPLRSAEDIAKSYTQLLSTDSDSQISVVRYGWQNPWWAMRQNEKFQLEAVFKDQLTRRSQDLPPLFCPTGAIWWAKAAVLRREGTYHVANRTGWEIPWQRGLDIDTEEDWLMAEVLLAMVRSG